MTLQNYIKKSKALATGVINTVPVFDKELELNVLANIAFNLKLQPKINILIPEDFYSLNNKEIYKHFSEMFNKKNVIELSAISKNINLTSLFNRQYGILSSQFNSQIERLKELTSKRVLQDIAYKTTVMISEEKDIKEIKDYYENEMSKIKLYSDKEITNEEIDEKLEEYLTQGKMPIIKTGFPKLDEAIGGFMNGTYSIIASAQSVGKTSFLINLLIYICNKLNKKILFASLETNFLALNMRIISNISGVPFSKMVFEPKKLNDDEWKKINNARAKLSKFRICWMGQKEISISDIRIKLKEKGNIDIVMIDYLRLLKSISPGKSLYETATNTSRELKILASEFDIPFVVVASINRDYSDRIDYMPHISDLRDSGNIEYDADLVLLLNRESAFREYKQGKDSNEFEFKHKAELIIAKGRFCESNLKISMFFDGSKSLIREVEEQLEII